MTSPERLAAQQAAFETLTIDCSRCHQPTALAYILPTGRGFHCQQCLARMHNREWKEISGTNDALNAVFKRLG